jgi:hypothetical protein
VVKPCGDASWNEGLTISLGGLPAEVLAREIALDIYADGERLGLAPSATNPPESRASLGPLTRLRARWLGATLLQIDYMSGFYPAGGPAAVAIFAFRGGDVAAAAECRPTYVAEEKNGPGCGVATTASATLEIPATLP